MMSVGGSLACLIVTLTLAASMPIGLEPPTSLPLGRTHLKANHGTRLCKVQELLFSATRSRRNTL